MYYQKTATIFLVSLTLTMGILASGCQDNPKSATGTSAVSSETALPVVNAMEIKKLLPDTVGQGKPAIVDFNSKFCLACQRISPKLEKVTGEHPDISLVKLDIQHQTENDKALMSAFQVATVPYVAFISADGNVKKVFIEDADMAEISKAAAAILPVKAAKS